MIYRRPPERVDRLASHVSAKHAHSLRVLDFGTATHVSKQMVEQICKTCTRLEELRLCLSKDSLVCIFFFTGNKPLSHQAIDPSASAFMLRRSLLTMLVPGHRPDPRSQPPLPPHRRIPPQELGHSPSIQYRVHSNTRISMRQVPWALERIARVYEDVPAHARSDTSRGAAWALALDLDQRYLLGGARMGSCDRRYESNLLATIVLVES